MDGAAFYTLAQPHRPALSQLDPKLSPTHSIPLHILFPPSGAVIILANICRTFTMPGIPPIAFPSLLHLTLTHSDEVGKINLVLLVSQIASPKSHGWNVGEARRYTPFIRP